MIKMNDTSSNIHTNFRWQRNYVNVEEKDSGGSLAMAAFILPPDPDSKAIFQCGPVICSAAVS